MTLGDYSKPHVFCWKNFQVTPALRCVLKTRNLNNPILSNVVAQCGVIKISCLWHEKSMLHFLENIIESVVLHNYTFTTNSKNAIKKINSNPGNIYVINLISRNQKKDLLFQMFSICFSIILNSSVLINLSYGK